MNTHTTECSKYAASTNAHSSVQTFVSV